MSTQLCRQVSDSSSTHRSGHVEFDGTDDDTIKSAGGRLRWHTQVRYTWNYMTLMVDTTMSAGVRLQWQTQVRDTWNYMALIRTQLCRQVSDSSGTHRSGHVEFHGTDDGHNYVGRCQTPGHTHVTDTRCNMALMRTQLCRQVSDSSNTHRSGHVVFHGTDDKHHYVGRCQTPVEHTGQDTWSYMILMIDTVMLAGVRLQWHTQVRDMWSSMALMMTQLCRQVADSGDTHRSGTR